MARTMASGRSGVRVMRASKGRSASSTAAASAAGGAIAPPSPRPFTPSGLRGLGVWWCAMRNGGICSELGIV
jgi:hypothetical protein